MTKIEVKQKEAYTHKTEVAKCVSKKCTFTIPLVNNTKKYEMEYEGIGDFKMQKMELVGPGRCIFIMELNSNRLYWETKSYKRSNSRETVYKFHSILIFIDLKENKKY